MDALVPVTIRPDDLEVVQRTARLLAVSGFFDAKGDTAQAIAQVATKILAGRELAFGPFAAVNGIHIIQGRPAVGANLMAAAVKGSGRYDYRVRKLDDAEVAIEFFAVAPDGKRESLGVSTFTAKDAKAAGTKNMDKFPRNMLFARAMSNGVRWYCPDVFGGNAVYVPEELGAEVDGDGNVIAGSVRAVEPPASTNILPHTETPRSGPENGLSADVETTRENDDNPFDTPWWETAYDRVYDVNPGLLGDLLAAHRTSDGPCTPKQYGYLCGLIDGIVERATGAEDGHRRVLSVICQTEITDANPPGAKAAGKLLARLAPQRRDAASNTMVANPDYDQATADLVVAIYQAAEATGTPRLIEAA